MTLPLNVKKAKGNTPLCMTEVTDKHKNHLEVIREAELD